MNRRGCSRSQISTAPVSARNTPDSRGAPHRHTSLDHESAPTSASTSATRYAPAAMPFVHVYRLTRQSHGLRCGTSYASTAAADEFAGAGEPEVTPCGTSPCSLHMNSPPSGRSAASGSSVA
jgi:hypothetical protein